MPSSAGYRTCALPQQIEAAFLEGIESLASKADVKKCISGHMLSSLDGGL